MPTPRVQKHLCCNVTKCTLEAKVARKIEPDIKAHRHLAYPNTAANYRCRPPGSYPAKNRSCMSARSASTADRSAAGEVDTGAQ